MIPRKYLPSAVRQAVYRPTCHSRGISTTTPQYEEGSGVLPVQMNSGSDSALSKDKPTSTANKSTPLYPTSTPFKPVGKKSFPKPPQQQKPHVLGTAAFPARAPVSPVQLKISKRRAMAIKRSGKLAGLPNYSLAQAQLNSVIQRRKENGTEQEPKGKKRGTESSKSDKPKAGPSSSSNNTKAGSSEQEKRRVDSSSGAKSRPLFTSSTLSSEIEAGSSKSSRPSQGEDEVETQRVAMEDIEALRRAGPDTSADAPSASPFSNLNLAEGSILATDVKITEVKPKRKMKVATLRSQLRRVLFSPGVHALQDPRTGMWNFDPDQLQEIPKPEEFAYDRSPPYIKPSLDEELAEMANENDCQFTGSTSTLTKALSQIYFAISGGKGIDISPLSQAFVDARPFYAAGATLPATLIIGKSKINPDKYYVDSDKAYDTENVLSSYGVILERMMISDPEEFQRFLKTAPDSAVSKEERSQKEAYMYQKASTILMRSQLDCYDPQLPGTGVFDIKTRACAPIRFDRANWLANSVYDISKDKGPSGSYEREYYDLIKSGMLKFSMQVRIGKMDGIFVAYHNTNRIYGFQYLPLTEMDERLFGSTELAEQAFQLTVGLLETLLKHIIECFPGEDVRVTLAANNVNPTPSDDRYIAAFVQPVEWDATKGIRPIKVVEMGVKSSVDGEEVDGAVEFSVDPETRKSQRWTVKYNIKTSSMDVSSQARARVAQASALRMLIGMLSLPTPEGKTPDDMYALEVSKSDRVGAAIDEEAMSSIRWVEPGMRVVQLRMEAKASGEEYERRKAGWRMEGDKRSWVDLDS
ncbi:mitochondrial protein Pet127-domain-containing protein [Naematelia encephala]|uniref:Mitochondrial protein Pet127-domain-containing protein n=1 Tax=Naematelia encephala TaxID=71784 RepID=A0A1Y2BFY2_9TREE|nr:mitochondrial protein Pet127-domain-containing protein [Naematelia encephala]